MMPMPTRFVMAIVLASLPLSGEVAAAAHRVLLQGRGQLAIVDDYMIGNCHAGAENPQLIELDPKTKRVVWSFHDFTTFGNDVSNTLILDEGADARR